MNITVFCIVCCLFPFFMTVLGSAAVFLCPRGMRTTARQMFLGFAAGVMLAASVWSLLNPAIAAAQDLGLPGWLPASAGLTCGVMFLLCADLTVARVRMRGKPTVGDGGGVSCDCQKITNVNNETGNSSVKTRRGSFLLQLAMTVHNIPEGMAVGLSAALAADALSTVSSDGVFSLGQIFCGGFTDTAAGAELMAATALSLGIGIQNFPEGAALSLPLRQEGLSSGRAFLRGCLSGIVEPIFGILTALVLSEAHAVMPWLLSFAAGAMLYVVAEELIPAANGGSDDGTARKHGGVSFIGTLSTMAGFLVMMVLDVALG